MQKKRYCSAQSSAKPPAWGIRNNAHASQHRMRIVNEANNLMLLQMGLASCKVIL